MKVLICFVIGMSLFFGGFWYSANMGIENFTFGSIIGFIGIAIFMGGCPIIYILENRIINTIEGCDKN